MSRTITVDTREGLIEALSEARGGETIALRGGDYGDLALYDGKGIDLSFDRTVTLVSADADNRAVFTGLDLRGATNLTFDGVVFDYTYAAEDELYSRPFQVVNGQNVTIRNSEFDGDLAEGRGPASDGLGFAIGLSVTGGQGIAVENNSFQDFYRGMVVRDVRDVTVTGNEMSQLRMDGMNFAQVDGARIEGNHLHDFIGSTDPADHRDMIQFWTNGTEMASRNVVIAGNRLDIGEGDFTHSIFMRNDQVDRGLAGREMFYENIEIRDNLIVNGHAHGIYVGETDGLVIRNNTVVHADGRNADGLDAAVEVPRIQVATTSTNVDIVQNITSGVIGFEGQRGWTLDDNLLVQDQNPRAEGYYSDLFLVSTIDGADDDPAFVLRPGTAAAGTGAGISHDTPGRALQMGAQFHVTQDADDPRLYHFSADPEGRLPAAASFDWRFADGSTASGRSFSHSFDDPGQIGVQLAVTLPGGTRLYEEARIEVPQLAVLSLQADGSFLAGDGGVTHHLAANGGPLDLGPRGVAALVAREHVADILGRDSFGLAFGLQADKPGTSGDLFRLHGSLVASIDRDGALYLRLFSEDGSETRLATRGVDLADGAHHDVTLGYEDGILSVYVDGALNGTAALPSPLADAGRHDLTFGNPWSGANFQGSIDRFDLGLLPGMDKADFDALAKGPKVVAELPARDTGWPGTPDTDTPDPDPVDDDTRPGDAGQTPGGTEEPDLPLLWLKDGQFLADGDDGTMTPIASSPEAGPSGIVLGKAGTAATVAREHVADILGDDPFEITLALRADGSPAPSLGDVFRLQGSLIVQVRDSGDMLIRAFSSDGDVTRLTTEGVDFNDAEPHEVTLRYTGRSLEVLVDGVLSAEARMAAPLADAGRHDLTFGNPWKGKNFAGTVEAFEVVLNATQTLAPETQPMVESAFAHLFEATGGLYDGSVVWETPGPDAFGAGDVTDLLPHLGADGRGTDAGDHDTPYWGDL